MKYTFLLIIIVASGWICNDAKSQGVGDIRDVNKKKEIDTCRLSVTYRVKINVDTLGKKFYYDNHALEIGNNMSRYYSIFAEDMDSVMWKARNEKSTNIDAAVNIRKNMAPNENGSYEDIFFNFPNQGLQTFIKRFGKNDYEYSEALSIFEWHVTAKRDTIIGYGCQQAVTEFRGRKWFVWFTQEIPISRGPWKFGGLPGLILKASDEKGDFCYTAIGIEQPENRLIYKYDILAARTTRANIMKLMELEWKDMKTLMLMNGFKDYEVLAIDKSTGKLVPVQNYVKSYIPRHEIE